MIGVKEYILAGNPCLFLKTTDPDTAQANLVSVIKSSINVNFHIVSWKLTGVKVLTKRDPDVTWIRQARSASDSISRVTLYGAPEADRPYNRPIVLIMHNVNSFITDPVFIQQVQDAVSHAAKNGCHLIFIGADLRLPVELRNLVTVVDCPLPSKEEIEKEYVKLVVAYKKDLELPKTKQELKQLISIAAMSAVGLDKIQAINAFALSMAATKTIDISIIQKQKEQEVKKSDVLEFIETTEPIGNLGGFSKLKKWLKKREEAFSVEAMNYGLRYPKGILIVGPPGTGKSLCAKTVASFLKLPLLRLDIGKVYRSLLGESEQAVRTALRIAEAVSPSVLWIDEIEKGMAGAQNSDLDAGVSSRVVSTILTWRQETKYPVVLVATANDTKSIPSTIYRAGRIDKVWAVDLPQEEERKEILRIHLEKRKRNPVNFDINVLAKASEYFVGSELESCIEDAMFNAFSEHREINTNDVVDAMKALIPQYVRDAEEIKEIREWVKTRADNVSDL